MWLQRVMPLVTRMSAALPWVWLAGTGLFMGQLVLGLFGAWRLRRQAEPLADERPAQILSRLADRLNVLPAAILQSDRIGSPTLVGFLRPVILLPRTHWLLWDDDRMEMVLLHELWHLRRRDNLVNAAQRIIESVLFFHPGVWIVSRWVRVDREHCCDQAVLRQTGHHLAYAEMLTAMATGNRARPRLSVAMGEHDLVGRVRLVLTPPQSGTRPGVGSLLGMAAVIGLSLFMGMGYVHAGESILPRVGQPSTDLKAEPPSTRNGRREGGAIDVPVESDKPAAMAAGYARASTEADKRTVEAAAIDGIRVHVVDETGAPVAGAKAGLRAKMKNGHLVGEDLLLTDNRGIVDVRSRAALAPIACDPTVPCLVVHEERGLVGLVILTADDWGRTFEVMVQRAVHVKVALEHPGFNVPGPRGLTWSKAFIGHAGRLSKIVRQTSDTDHTHDFILPPGEYQLLAFAGNEKGRKTEFAFRCFSVPEGGELVDLNVVALEPLQKTDSTWTHASGEPPRGN
jgi:beta-lactamase regulating signal transducer with metallopeptidase domain